MYKIGEFSILCETTLKTLRHYDEKGILKPCKVDEFSGYRFYSEEQVILFRKIKNLQTSGFSLEEIKQIISNCDKSLIESKIDSLEKETKNKIKILREMKSSMIRKDFDEVNNVIFEPYPQEFIDFACEYAEIKSRSEIKNILNRIDKKLKKYLRHYDEDVYFVENDNYGYNDENISCYIGRFLKFEDARYVHNKIKQYIKPGKLMVLSEHKDLNCLHARVESSIIKAYQDIIEFANINNIQISGAFREVYNKGQIDIYVIACDLLDYDQSLATTCSEIENTLEDKVDSEFVGKWQMVAEMSLDSRLFNPKRKYYVPESNLNLLILNSDGTTNIDNITWKENRLIIKKKDFTDIGTINKIKSSGRVSYKIRNIVRMLPSSYRKGYIKVSMNMYDTPCAKDYTFIYKKIK